MKELVLTSPAFVNNEVIPIKYTGDGQDINPPFLIEGIPEATKSLALIFDDPDAVGGTFDHWIVWDIPASTNEIKENSVPGTEGLNSGQEIGYTGPYPPPGKVHRYTFRIYALDAKLGLNQKSTKKDLQKAMKGHILAEGKLIGLFNR